VSGRATVVAFTVNRHPWLPGFDPPYVIANVALAEDPTVRLTSGWSSGTGQVEPRLAFESHLFTKALKLRYSAPIGVPGQTTEAEYRINKTLSLQAEWDTESHQATPVGDIGLDLKLRWEGE